MDMSKARTFVYKEGQDPKMVYSVDAQDYYDDGWVDSPAKFGSTMETFKVDPDDEVAVQNLGDTLKGVTAAANGAINLELMTKKELVAYAGLHFGRELSPKDNRDKLLNEVKHLVGCSNDDSTENN